MARDDTRRQSHLMLESILPPIRETQKEEKASHVDLGNRSKDPVRLRKRRREGSSGDEMVDGTLDLAAVKTAQVGLDVGVFTAVKEESPWGSFEPIYDLKLGDFVTVAIRNTPEREIVIVKTLSGPGKDERLEVTRQVRHRNFLGLKDIFDYEGVFHNVFEFVPICLFHLVACPAYPTASQLAAIIAQILDGIEYLDCQGLQHGSLGCSTVLVSREGEIKITAAEDCSRSTHPQPAHRLDVKALGYIAMELMQKQSRENGIVGVQNLERWPCDSDAVAFLSTTTSEPSIHDLKKHALLQRPWRQEELKGLVGLAEVSAYRGYRYGG